MNKLLTEHFKSYAAKKAIQHALRILISVVIALILYHHFDSSQNYWIVFSGFLLVQIRLGTTFWRQILWVVLLGCLAGCTAWIAGRIGANVHLLSLYLFSTSLVCVEIGLIYPELFLSTFLINLFGMLSGGLPINLTDSNERLYLVLLGAGIVVLVNVLFWPRNARRNFSAGVARCLNAMSDLQNTFYKIYLKRNYLENHYVYEKQIHEQTSKVLFMLKQLHRLNLSSEQHQIVENLMRLYEVVIAQGHLRFRVQDFTTFEIIAREVQALIDANFKTENLSRIVASLEDVYHNTLQVAAAEPLAYLFFIQATQEFDRELNNLYAMKY